MYSRLLFAMIRPASRLYQTRCGVLQGSFEINRKVGPSETVFEQPVRLVTDQSFEQNSDDKKWRNGSIEKAIGSTVITGVMSFFVNKEIERHRLQKETELNRIRCQIKDLYGPLYGNRVVSDSSYRAVMTNHEGLKKYLQEAREKKDADMIHRWRSYVWEDLYPLDEKAVKMILANAHLVITEGQFPEEFEHLLNHAARIQFVMKHWKADDGTLLPAEKFTEKDYLEETNASGIEYRTAILDHTKDKYKQLCDKQLEIKGKKHTNNLQK